MLPLVPPPAIVQSVDAECFRMLDSWEQKARAEGVWVVRRVPMEHGAYGQLSVRCREQGRVKSIIQQDYRLKHEFQFSPEKRDKFALFFQSLVIGSLIGLWGNILIFHQHL